jgi:hypothetical protein
MATMSLAIPMATKVKKTASRKMTTALRGAFRKGFEEFMDSGHPLRFQVVTASIRSFPSPTTWVKVYASLFGFP